MKEENVKFKLQIFGTTNNTITTKLSFKRRKSDLNIYFLYC